MTLVAIHQPNFFPWLGYFDKIRRADVFIFLDDVAYPKNGWTNRVQINVQGKAQWLTAPVSRAAFGRPIREASFDDRTDWRGKAIKTLEANYARAPGFDSGTALLEPLLRNPEGRLADYNIAAIERVARHLGLKAKFLRQSALGAEGAANELLVNLICAAGGDAYLLGGGAGDYHDESVFAAAGIAVVRQNFEPRSYGDPDRFLPGLSVIDYLMHDGTALR